MWTGAVQASLVAGLQLGFTMSLPSGCCNVASRIFKVMSRGVSEEQNVLIGLTPFAYYHRPRNCPSQEALGFSHNPGCRLLQFMAISVKRSDPRLWSNLKAE